MKAKFQPRRGIGLAGLIAALVIAPTLTQANQETDGYHVKWHNGLRIESPDGQFKLKLGGRTYLDFASVSGSEGIKNGPGGTGTGVEVRTARFYAAGTLYENLVFKSQFDFSGGAVTMKDLYVGIKHIPFVGSAKFGHLKEPFGLEEHTSSRFISFMERGLPAAMVPSRNVGLLLGRPVFDHRATWSIGGFRDYGKNGKAFSNAGAYNVTARVTGAPVYANDGATVVHLGIAYSHQFRSPAGAVKPRYKASPESHLAPHLVDTGALASDGVDLIGAELAAVMGPASLQAEYTLASVSPATGSRAALWGAYVEGSVFLTGEHRNYVPKKGGFGRVALQHRFDPKAGTWGAWQLAVRYSHLDLNNVFAAGGREQDVTAGINWYLFPNMRLMANYVYATAVFKSPSTNIPGTSHANIFQMRAQIDF